MTNANNVIAFPNRIEQVREEKRIARGEGVKYDRNLSINDIAKLVRGEIKAALPGYKTSVRIKKYSGGQSLSVDIKGIPDGVVLLNSLHTAWNEKYPHDSYSSYPADARSRFGTEVTAAIALITSIVNAYNHDRSDSQTDYFDVNFYEHIGVDWQFVRDTKAGL